MACAKSNIQQHSGLEDQGIDFRASISGIRADERRPKAVAEQQIRRRSLRLQAIQQSHKQPLSNTSHPPGSNAREARKILQDSKNLCKSSQPSKKRKRGEGKKVVEHNSSRNREQISFKQSRVPSIGSAAGIELKKERRKGSASNIVTKSTDPLEYWTVTKSWPKEYFERHNEIKIDFEQDSWLEEQREIPVADIKYVEVDGFRIPCPIRKLPTSVRRKKSDSNFDSSDDQTNREKKSAPYRTVQYSTLLELKGSYMYRSDLGITKESKALYLSLLELEQAIPLDSLFREDLFEKTCRKIEGRNEAKVIQDIARLIIPSAETLATYGATNLDYLIEGINETWTNNIAVEGPLPKPDYSVGFRRSAFSDEKLRKLDKLIGSVFETSLFVATYRMYFPFFTCEVKCGAASLDIADRQNAHSMTVALRALVELYRAVKRERELDRKILTFSISHDHASVRIYGHYPIITEEMTTFYRHPIHSFSFTALDGKEKWTAYKFAKNIYDHHTPLLHKMICSAIDDMPASIDFSLSQSASFSQPTPERSQQSNSETEFVPAGTESQPSSLLVSQQVTPTTSFTQPTEPAFKKSRT